MAQVENRPNVCAGNAKRHLDIPAGEALFKRGETSQAVFLVCAGVIKTQRVTPDGELVVAGVWLPGDVIGLEALGETEYEFDAVATKASQVVRLGLEQILDACAQQPKVNTWFTRKMGSLLRRKDLDQISSKGLPSNERILRFFLDLHERTGRNKVSEVVEGELPMHKQDIARYLNMTPETLSRNLLVLRRKHLLLISRTHYSVPDVSYARRVTQL
jgi:CRP/FNR family transcriptional regulator